MLRRTRALRSALATTLAVTCLTACGSSGSSDDDGAGSANDGAEVTTGTGGGSEGTFLKCPPGAEFHLTGDVAGQPVDITDAPTTGGFSQQSNPPGPHFRLPAASAEDDDQLIVVYLTWNEVAASGEVMPIQGWIRLPLEGPLAGQTICAGTGSEMTIPGPDAEDEVGDFQFRLRELAGGTDCTEPLSGELRGCWRH